MTVRECAEALAHPLPHREWLRVMGELERLEREMEERAWQR